MTLFSDPANFSNVAVSIQTEGMGNAIEDYEKLPLSIPNESPHESVAPLDHLSRRTLTRLTVGCSCISILLLLIGSMGNQPVLVTEGVHSLTDALCYGIAWVIDAKSRQHFPMERTLPFGIRRLTVLGGFFIGCFTATSMLFISLENIRQLVRPESTTSDHYYSTWAILIGFSELFFNAFVLLLHSHGHSHSHSSHDSCNHSKGDANTEGALMHALTDLTTASIVIISSVLELLVADRVFVWVNLIGCAIIFSVMAGVAVKLIKENGRILLQATPQAFPLDDLVLEISGIKGVVLLKVVRVWQVDHPENLTGSLVVEIGSESDHRDVVSSIRDACRKFHVMDVIIEAR